jgi:hypothetical protein
VKARITRRSTTPSVALGPASSNAESAVAQLPERARTD